MQGANLVTNANDSNTAGQTSTGENVKFVPKVIIKDCWASKKDIHAGDDIQVTIVLENTSRSEKLRNMTVTVAEPENDLNLVSDTDTVFIDTVKAGGKIEVTRTYHVSKTAPEGQYILNVSVDYANSEGTTYTYDGKARIYVGQPVRLAFDPVMIEKNVQVADILRVNVQAMNLGRSKVYNVRVAFEGDGMQAEASVFIGDIEPGTTGNGTMNVTITGLSSGHTPYGKAEGVLTFFYEDEAGNAYEETQDISTYIEAPVTSEKNESKDMPNQWWIIMAILGALLTFAAAGIAVKMVKHRSA